MAFDADWTHGVDHMWTRHRASVAEASEALADPDALLFDPDPKSTSSKSARLLGYSPTATAVLAVILVRREERPGALVGRERVASQQHGPAALSRRQSAMSTNAKQLVEQIADEADASRDKPLPAEAAATRPNKSVPVAVRLAPEDVAAIEDLAAQLDVPMSALLRGWIVAALAGQREESLSSAIDRIAADVQRLRELTA